MATGTRQTNTFVEQLHKLLGGITDLKTADDADLPFAINLETMILSRLKGGADAAMQPQGQGQPPGQAPPGQGPPMGDPMSQMAGGAPAGLMGSPAPPPGMGSPAGVPGLQQGPQMPNADELRRMLQRATVAKRLPATAASISGI